MDKKTFSRKKFLSSMTMNPPEARGLHMDHSHAGLATACMESTNCDHCQPGLSLEIHFICFSQLYADSLIPMLQSHSPGRWHRGCWRSFWSLFQPRFWLSDLTGWMHQSTAGSHTCPWKYSFTYFFFGRVVVPTCPWSGCGRDVSAGCSRLSSEVSPAQNLDKVKINWFDLNSKFEKY